MSSLATSAVPPASSARNQLSADGVDMNLLSGDRDAPGDVPDLHTRVVRALSEQGVDVAGRSADIERFVGEITRSIKTHQAWARDLEDPERAFGRADIIYCIHQAKLSGDIDEALWRVFLATHFGRTSCEPAASQLDSAARFLCAFADIPVWTWRTVSASPTKLELWLEKHHAELATLRFGNHRKHETNSQPAELFKVFESIIAWVQRNGGRPQTAFSTDGATTPEAAFKMLYRRLMGHPSHKDFGIHRFGRTACFDMLMLMADFGLAAIRPGSCYLTGSTGPQTAAKELWGARLSDPALEVRAETLAKKIEVPMNVVEDALCIWQK